MLKYNAETKKFETMSVEEENEVLKDDYKKLLEEYHLQDRQITKLENENKKRKFHQERSYKNIGDIVEHFIYGDIQQVRQEMNKKLAEKDLELYENNKLSDGEVLSFKSKNNAIEPYSGLWIRTPNNKLMISSLPNTSNWIELDLSQQILKNRKSAFRV